MQMLGGKCFVRQLKPLLQQKNVKIVIPLQTVTAAMKLKDTCSWEEKHTKLRQYIEKQRHYFADKGPSSQSYDFSSSSCMDVRVGL